MCQDRHAPWTPGPETEHLNPKLAAFLKGVRVVQLVWFDLAARVLIRDNGHQKHTLRKVPELTIRISAPVSISLLLTMRC